MEYCAEIANRNESLKDSAKPLFRSLVDANLFTLKFHVLNHFMEDVIQFDKLRFPDASAFDHFNLCYKINYSKHFRQP